MGLPRLRKRRTRPAGRRSTPGPVPEWFLDAKFGIFIHWGVYSVPAWGGVGEYSEWYWYHLARQEARTIAWWQFHKANYGEDFRYQDFAPRFRAELFDAAKWADIFARSGANYVVPTSKHHDGFCLWPSAEASRTWGRPWNAVEIGRRRDMLGELAEAVRAARPQVRLLLLALRVVQPALAFATANASSTSTCFRSSRTW